MKRINQYTIGVLFTLLSLLITGCSNFDDLNTNPDGTTVVNAPMLCTGAITSVIKAEGSDAKGVIATNAFPKYVGYANEGQMSEQYNLIGNTGFGQMTTLVNLDKMIGYATGTPAENSYRGVAKFLRAIIFFNSTMELGDIPYSEAGKAEAELYKPRYDSQEAVLEGILNELKDADKYLAKGIQFDGDATAYKGDPAKWRKAANAFALKILMSLSKKEKVGAIDVKKRFSEIVSQGAILDAYTGFLGLNYSSINRHPLYSTKDQFTGRTLISSLLIDNLKNLNDRRLFYIAEPAGAQITGGKSANDPAAYVGLDVSMEYAKMNEGFNNNKYSILNLRYQQEEASEPFMYITFGEQQLILSEAVIRGWIAGDAKVYYESGVKSALADKMTANTNFAHGMPITQEYIDSYFTGNAAFANIAAEQLKQIWMQRYILSFMQVAKTSYFEYRRNNYPDFPINPETNLNIQNKNAMPLRWMYPSSETSYNRDNLIQALNDQFGGYDDVNAKMWLLK